MSYQAHVTDVAYCYDGSFAGFLCCVFESYARREIPAEVCPPEEGGSRAGAAGRTGEGLHHNGLSLHGGRQGSDAAALCTALF